MRPLHRLALTVTALVVVLAIAVSSAAASPPSRQPTGRGESHVLLQTPSALASHLSVGPALASSAPAAPFVYQQAELSRADAGASDCFGCSAAVSGGTALIGAYGKTVANQFEVGAAYVYTQSGTTWSQEAELSDPDSVQSDCFGSAVALSGDVAVVGAPV
jgi:hypothetical protein